MRAVQWISTLAILLVLVAVVRWSPPALPLTAASLEMVLTILGGLFLVALCVERSLDVFLTTFRGGRSGQLDAEMQQIDKALKQAKESPAAAAAVPPARDIGLLEQTKQARWLEPKASLTLGEGQWRLFQLVDVFITGGVTAGGSDGVHKLIEVYRGITKSASKQPE